MQNRMIWESRFRLLNPDTGELEERLDISVNVNESGVSRERLAELFRDTSEKVFDIVSGNGSVEIGKEDKAARSFFQGKGWF